MSGENDHVMTVVYTNADDGLWLDCSCGFRAPAGFSPDVDDLIALRVQHLERHDWRDALTCPVCGGAARHRQVVAAGDSRVRSTCQCGTRWVTG